MDSKAKKASVEQKNYLVGYMEENTDFANDRFESVDGARIKGKKWEELTLALNSIGGAVKDASQWKKFWSDQKSHVKQREILRKAALAKSGVNGLARNKQPSDFEARVLQLMSPAVISGNEQVGELLTVTENTAEEILMNLSQDVLPDTAPAQQNILEATPDIFVLPSTPAQAQQNIGEVTPEVLVLPSTSRNTKRKTLTPFEEQYLQLEKKKIKIMEDNQKLQQEKFKAAQMWKEKHYELELRKLILKEKEIKMNKK